MKGLLSLSFLYDFYYRFFVLTLFNSLISPEGINKYTKYNNNVMQIYNAMYYFKCSVIVYKVYYLF